MQGGSVMLTNNLIMTKEQSENIINYLLKKVCPIKIYLKENFVISSFYEPSEGTSHLMEFLVDGEEKIRNLMPLMLENTRIQAEDKVMLINSYIRESLIEGTKDTKSFSFVLNRNHFEDCVFLNMNFDDTCWECVFKNCIFINCHLNGSYFCNNNKIDEDTNFDESTCDENKKILTEYYPMACPSEGGFVAWKKVRSVERFEKGPRPYLVKLYIPEDAQRTSSFSSKCRASKAVVLDIINPKTMKPEQIDVCSITDPNFKYKIGETVKPIESFEPDRFIECGPGIHFFLNKYEALHY